MSTGRTRTTPQETPHVLPEQHHGHFPIEYQQAVDAHPAAPHRAANGLGFVTAYLVVNAR